MIYNHCQLMNKVPRAAASSAMATSLTSSSPPSSVVLATAVLSSSSERRIAKYKEERRRQLASQIASRLSNRARSSSSSSSAASGDESSFKVSKYRRYRLKKSDKDNAGDVGGHGQSSLPPNRRRPRRPNGALKGTAASNSTTTAESACCDDTDGEENREVPDTKRNRAISSARPLQPAKSNAPPMRYSSEELLLEAASSLRSLQGDVHTPKPLSSRETCQPAQVTSPTSKCRVLASPEMVKSISKTLMPPISPFRSPSSGGATSASTTPTSVPISDPLIDAHWPGRPKIRSGLEHHRPQSAILSCKTSPSRSVRRKSDFTARYEVIMDRALAALNAVKDIDLELLSHGKGLDEQEEDLNVQDAGIDSGNDVEFNEEQVLQTCKNFIKDYDKKKQEDNNKSILRTRSSSWTIHDKRSSVSDHKSKTSEDSCDKNVQDLCGEAATTSVKSVPRPILKKNSDDLKLIPILKNRELREPIKRKSMTDADHRPDHVRIRCPSPEEDSIAADRSVLPKPILRSRKSSLGDDYSSPDVPQSILKRRSSHEDLLDEIGSAFTSGATSRSSPEPPHGILKRKSSIGSLISNSHSPDGSIAGSILKKSQSQLSSCQCSLEDLTGAGTAEVGEKIRSILKKRSTFSTDDEFESSHEKPKSILKSRRSEESLSPLSDPVIPEFFTSNSSLSNSTTAASGCERVKAILKLQDASVSCDSSVAVTSAGAAMSSTIGSSLLDRDKSLSPTRKMNPTSPPEPTEMLFCGSSGMSTPVRRASVPISPRRISVSKRIPSEPTGPVDTDAVLAESKRSSSFVTKATVFIDGSAKSPQRGSTVASDVLAVSAQESHDSSVMDHSHVPRKRSILKNDFADQTIRTKRGVLKKDSSYDETLKPILKNPLDNPEPLPITNRPSSSSSEDLELLLESSTSFSGVVIDPIPASARDLDSCPESKRTASSPVKSRKSSLVHPRQPVIPPSSVKISADGNLADQLECLADRAEAELKKLQLQNSSNHHRPPTNLTSNHTENGKPDHHCKPIDSSDVFLRRHRPSVTSRPQSAPPLPPSTLSFSCSSSESISTIQRPSQDISAEGYYRIYKESKAKCEQTRSPALLATMEQKTPEIKVPGGGIAERLAALKKSGDEDWKKKVYKHDPVMLSEPLKKNNRNSFNAFLDANVDNEVILRVKSGQTTIKRPTSLMERKSQLEESQSTWKNRINEKDMSQFTVAGKMAQIKATSPVLPPANIRNDTKSRTHIQPRKFKGRPSSPSTQLRHQSSAETPSLPSTPALSSDDFDDDLADCEIDSFFKTSSTRTEQCVFDFDLECLSARNEEPLVHLKRAAPKMCGRKNKGSRNPIKALAMRKNQSRLSSDLSERASSSAFHSADDAEDAEDSGRYDEYHRFKRATNERSSVHSHLAAEALAGLASHEDFTKMELRKNNTAVPHKDFLPYKTQGVMLIQIKGRRECQARLVEPQAASINSGDAFILVTSNELYLWIGQFANVIERSRASDMADVILQKKDLGCKAAQHLRTIYEEKVSACQSDNVKFWKLLGQSTPPESVCPAGPAEEDYDYETSINETNMVWRVDPMANELIPEEDYWGTSLRHELLDKPEAVLVLDFGTEMYVWNGVSAPFNSRNAGRKLAQDLFTNGIDGSGHLNPRPHWHIFGKVNQNMETMLFRGKFINWPDSTRLIKPDKATSTYKMCAEAATGSKPYDPENSSFDVSQIVAAPLEEPNLELEMTCLGRGRSYYDEVERRQYEIESLSIKVWHVSENGIVQLTVPDNLAQFHVEDTYVVRWKYKVSLTGRDLKGRPSKHLAVGRERWAYFFWQGEVSRVTEKGISALMTVELDKEKGPQIRVDQGKEPAAFLNLWTGKMMVFLGRRGQMSKQPEEKPWRLFAVRGEAAEEAHAVEVEFAKANLRSRGSFLMLNVKEADLYVWHGQCSPQHVRQMAHNMADVVQKYKPEACLIKATKPVVIHTVFENEGLPPEIQRAMASSGEYDDNIPALPNPEPCYSTRMFFMSSASGEFQVNEVVYPFLSQSVPNLMPFLQSDLYSADQPALFMLDVACGETLWLWQGWWPDVGHDITDTNVITGSGLIRWHAERRAAMQTTVDYAKRKYGSKPVSMRLVWAGHEPVAFTNLFPVWKNRPDVKQLNEKVLGNDCLESALARLSRTTYTWAELQQRPLPDGVDPSRLETYLNDDEFQVHMGLSRQEFNSFAKWKQLEIRKEKGLF